MPGDNKSPRRLPVVYYSALAAFALAGIDVGRATVDPSSITWAWFTVSCIVAALGVGSVAMLADARRRKDLVTALERITGRPSAAPSGNGPRDRRVVASALAAAAAVTVLGSILIARAPAEATGDDAKAVHAALLWHDAISGDAEPMPAEPKPAWILAGMLSDGTAESALRAARLLSLSFAVTLTLLVCLVAGARAGPLATLVAAVALVFNPGMWNACSFASDDALMMTAFGAGALLLPRALRNPRLWPVVGLAAGVAGTCRSTGVVLVVVLVAALVATRRLEARAWPWLAAAIVAALVCLVPHGYWVLIRGEVSRDSELIGLLTLHGPQAMQAEAAKDIPPFPGWPRALLDTVGIMRVGDLVVGSLMTFKPFQLWMLPVLVVPAILGKNREHRWILWSLMAVVCLLMGMTGWKGGDSSVPFYLIGPVAAVTFGVHATSIAAAVRTNTAVKIVVSLICAAMVGELVFRALAPLG